MLAKPPGPANPLVLAVVFDGLAAFEFSCVAEIFAPPRPEHPQVRYRFETAGPRARQEIRASLGMQVVPTRDFSDLRKAGTVVVIGPEGDPAVAMPERLAGELQTAHAAGARIVSICTGAFILAAAGLLDGKRATTHWRFADMLQRRYPRVDVDPSVLYTEQGRVLTSAGSAAAIDLCLHVVRTDYGAEVANHIAKGLVVQPHRDGGQAQFIERPVSRREKNRIGAVMEAMQLRLAEDISIPELARLAAMSERTFMRRFKEATGTTPGDWLRVARMDRARQLLETSRSSIEVIAAECGFGTATTLRQQFRKRLGISPTEYKKRFQPRLAS